MSKKGSAVVLCMFILFLLALMIYGKMQEPSGLSGLCSMIV